MQGRNRRYGGEIRRVAGKILGMDLIVPGSSWCRRTDQTLVTVVSVQADAPRAVMFETQVGHVCRASMDGFLRRYIPVANVSLEQVTDRLRQACKKNRIVFLLPSEASVLVDVVRDIVSNGGA